MNQQPPRSASVDLIWTVPLGLLVAAGSRFTNLPEEGAVRWAHQPWIALALGSIAALGLFASLRRPLTGAAMTFGAVALFVMLDLRDGPIYFTLAASGFLVAARVPPRRWAHVLSVGTLLVCAALVVRAIADFQNEQSLWQLLATFAVVAAGVAIGTLTRARALAVGERARAAATQEQLRMAQDLHDGVGHGLAVIAMHAGVGLHVLDRDPAAARTALEAIRDSARESLDALRADLAQLAGEQAPRRPRRGVADLDQLLDRVRAAGPSVELVGSPGPLPDEVDALAYRLVQEGLTNVMRHASATTVVVRLDRGPDRLTVSVQDDGRGLGSHTTGHDEGMGLRGLRERVERLGGSFSAGPRQVGGFELQAVLPL